MEDRDNLTDIFLRRDPIRWTAGALAGLFAGLVMLGFAVALAKVMGADPLAPVKMGALPFIGGEAMDYDNSRAVIVGFIAHELMCFFLGIVYAHVTGTNRMGPLLGVGLTWGVFGWIFINNLFSPSFRDFFVAQVPSGAMFFVWLVFGVMLSSVGFFDKKLRGGGSPG